MKQSVVLLLSCVGPAFAVEGAVFTADNLNLLIPDGKGSGLVSAQTLLPSQVAGPITALSVSLTISGIGASGAFNGDLYATLVHDSGFAVLLNRPGKTAVNPWGYSDNGLTLTLADGAPDIHTYRTTLGGAPAGSLAGTWSPDGRTADPGAVTDSLATRTTAFGDFLGLEASGQWTLFVADLEAGGQARLDSWGLTLDTAAAVPEPAAGALVVGLGLVGFAFWRRPR